MTDKRPKSLTERIRQAVADAASMAKPLKITPKGRPSGPNLRIPHETDAWHEPFSQAEMRASAEGLLTEERCWDCGCRLVKGTGELREGKYCGGCYNTRQEAIEHPPAA